MKMKASFNLETVEGKMRAYNAMNGSGRSMKDLQNGEVIEGIGVLQYETKTDTYGKEQEVTVTVIFGKDGESYASVSESVSKAGDNLIDFLSDTGLEEFKICVVKAKSKQGNDFLNLKLLG